MASVTGADMGMGACSVAGSAETAGAGSASVTCMSASTTGAAAASGSEAGPETGSTSCNHRCIRVQSSQDSSKQCIGNATSKPQAVCQ